MNPHEIPSKTSTPLFKPMSPDELKPRPTDKPIVRDEVGSPVRKAHSYYVGALDPKNNRFASKDSFMMAKGQVKKSPISGYGVFAIEDIKAGDLIEECPVVILDTTFTQNTDWVLNRYCFTWVANNEIDHKNGHSMAMVLGNGMVYNHGDIPNSYFIQDSYLKVYRLYALSDIKIGEEITWYYGEGYAQRLQEERKMTSDPHIPEGFIQHGTTGPVMPAPKDKGCGCGKKATDVATKKAAHPVSRMTPPKLDVVDTITPNPNITEELQVKSIPQAETLLFRSMVVPEIILNNDKI